MPRPPGRSLTRSQPTPSRRLTLRHTSGAVELVVVRDDQHVRIEVNDEGPGIDVAQRQAIFDKFQRLESRAPGSGLGLWLCQKLVNRMHGRIWVADAPSGGSSFIVEFPASAT